MTTPWGQLLQAVARRRRLSNFAHRWYLATALTGGAYLLLLLAGRLLGLLPDVFAVWTVLIVPAFAGLVALWWHQRPTAEEAARLVDHRLGSHDLFLTAAMLDGSPGEFQPLVARDAEKRAAGVQAATIAPFQAGEKLARAATVLALLVLAVVFVPVLDVFGHQAERQLHAERQQRLEASRQLTVARAAELERQPLEAMLSPAVDQQLTRLEQTFHQMKPQDPTGNIRQLNEHQREIGEAWRRQSEQRLRQAMNQKTGAQRFGAADRIAQQREWQQQLQEGKTDGMQQELKELGELAERMKSASTDAERQAMRDELAQRLQSLSEFANQTANSPELAEALSRALQQLDMADISELSQDAIDAMCETLALSQQEMEALAQSLRDLQNMEQALQAIQLARMLAAAEMLDGEACEGCNGMGDYIALYQSMMAAAGSGSGLGMGGPGIGEGGAAPEDPSIATDFTPERAPSQFQPGRILMQWKTQEVSQPGQAVIDFRESLSAVRQNVSEAILHEQVPPGYHGVIHGYFDTIDRSLPAATEP